MRALISEGHRRFYMHAPMVLRKLRRITVLDDVKRYAKGFLAVAAARAAG